MHRSPLLVPVQPVLALQGGVRSTVGYQDNTTGTPITLVIQYNRISEWVVQVARK